MAITKHECGEGGECGDFANMMGPGQVDGSLRHALQMLWMVMPKERRTPEEVEKEYRRLVERLLRDFREDAQAFGPRPPS